MLSISYTNQRIEGTKKISNTWIKEASLHGVSHDKTIGHMSNLTQWKDLEMTDKRVGFWAWQDGSETKSSCRRPEFGS